MRITTNIVFKNIYASRISGFPFFSLFDEQAGFHIFAIFEYLKLILNTALKIPFPLLFKYFFVSLLHPPCSSLTIYGFFLLSGIYCTDFCKGMWKARIYKDI